MEKEQFLAILRKYNDGTASEEEKEFLRTYYNLFEKEPEVLQAFSKRRKTALKDRIERRLLQQIEPGPSILAGRGILKYAAAAAIILIVGSGGYFLLHQPPTLKTGETQTDDVAPGGNKAILTLANGKKIVLTDLHTGKVAQQANLQINNKGNGQIAYVVNHNIADGNTAESAYNTIETPRGGQAQVVLVDGTTAYLDAASSIHFPVTFSGKERKVAITGQVYFEVVHNPKQPFEADVKGLSVQDIGTHFNVNAYDVPEVTLTEGSISVAGRVLKPGQQAVGQTNSIIVKQADIEEAIAWKNGYFRFNSENIKTIMNQLARWYNIDIAYQGQLTAEQFSGTVSRSKNISQVLKMLAYSGAVHFKIEGRRVTVSR